MIKPSRQNITAFAAIFLLLLFHAANNTIILKASDNRLLSADESQYAQTMLEIARDITNPLTFPYNKCLLQLWKPPLYYFVCSPLLLLKRSINMLAMANIFFLGISLFAVYGAGKKLYGFRAGLLAAFLFSMLPAVFAMSRMLLFETALTTMVSLTFYLFVLNRFDSWKFSVLSGLVIGLGFLTKELYGLYLIPILAYFFIQPGNFRKSRLMFFFMALLIGCSIAFPWYFAKGFLYPQRYYTIFAHTFAPDPEKTSFLFFTRMLFFRQLLPAYFILATAAIIYFIREKKYFMPAVCLSLLLTWSFATNKQDRFILPLFPFIALISSGFVSEVAGGKRFIIAVFAAASLLQFAFVSYFPEAAAKAYFFPSGSHLEYYYFTDLKPFSQSGIYSACNDSGDFRTLSVKVAQTIRSYYFVNRHFCIMLITSFFPNIQYELTLTGMDIEFRRIGASYDVDMYSDAQLETMYSNDVYWSDFVIIDVDSHDRNNRTRDMYVKCFCRRLNDFKVLWEGTYPDGSKIRMYKRKMRQLVPRNCSVIGSRRYD